MTKPVMTAEEFKLLEPKLGRLTLDTVKIARRVLVDGLTRAEVAEDSGLTRQRVSQMVQHVMNVANAIPSNWERVDEWLPPELAEQVRAMAAKAREAQEEKTHA